jgi:hypothetical protein
VCVSYPPRLVAAVRDPRGEEYIYMCVCVCVYVCMYLCMYISGAVRDPRGRGRLHQHQVHDPHLRELRPQLAEEAASRGGAEEEASTSGGWEEETRTHARTHARTHHLQVLRRRAACVRPHRARSAQEEAVRPSCAPCNSAPCLGAMPVDGSGSTSRGGCQQRRSGEGGLN